MRLVGWHGTVVQLRGHHDPRRRVLVPSDSPRLSETLRRLRELGNGIDDDATLLQGGAWLLWQQTIVKNYLSRD